MTEIKTIEDGQKDALLLRSNIKKKKVCYAKSMNEKEDIEKDVREIILHL